MGPCAHVVLHRWTVRTLRKTCFRRWTLRGNGSAKRVRWKIVRYSPFDIRRGVRSEFTILYIHATSEFYAFLPISVCFMSRIRARSKNIIHLPRVKISRFKICIDIVRTIGRNFSPLIVNFNHNFARVSRLIEFLLLSPDNILEYPNFFEINQHYRAYRYMDPQPSLPCRPDFPAAKSDTLI